jgi:hypothetical protein
VGRATSGPLVESPGRRREDGAFAAAGLAAALARWRGGRLLHPRGRSLSARVEARGPLAQRILGTEGQWPATVRVSRGVPTPEGWPDVLGFAVRIHLPTGPVDVLVSSAGRMPVLRHIPLPRRDFAGPYTSVVPFRLRGRPVYLAVFSDRPMGRSLDAVVAATNRGDAVLRLAAATPTSGWHPFARIILGAPLPDTVDAALAFDPAGNLPENLRPVGLIQRLRTAAYAVSRHGRGTPDPPRRSGAASGHASRAQ